ncbi:MAG: Sec-independent protein translocase protein TatB [Pseudomonadota bacterium]
MFDLGFWEILVIGIVAIIVVGPERLPGMAYTVGKWITKVKRFVANAKAEVESEFNTAELRKLMSAQEEEMHKLRQLLEDTRHDVEQSQQLLSKSVEEVAQSVRESATPVSVDSVSAPEAGTLGHEAAAEADSAKSQPEPLPSEPALPAMAAQSIEDEMQALSQSLGETLHRPSFGAASDDAPAAPTTPPPATKASA